MPVASSPADLMMVRGSLCLADARSSKSPGAPTNLGGSVQPVEETTATLCRCTQPAHL
jgi:hypothetical protein